MLRIHIEEQCESATIRLEGRLAGPWVDELEQCWMNLVARLNLPVIIELDMVTFMDVQGHWLLAEMHRAGAILVGRGVLSQYLAEQIQQHQSG